MLFNIVKFFHIFFVITAAGSNITDGVWQARAGNDPAHESVALRGVKLLDDRVANPAYLLVLVTGLFDLAGYSPALTRQIETLERSRSSS